MQIKINQMPGVTGHIPVRAHHNDAGADIYTCDDVTIAAHSTQKIPLGFALELPDGYMACVYPRSGMSLMGLVCELPPIDAGYRGEVHAIVSNLTDHAITVLDNTRIGQIVVLPCVIADFVPAFGGDERGDGAFGSTGIH